jgi:hypothetical protein
VHAYYRRSPLVFKLVDAAQKSWRRLDGHNQLPKLIQGVRFTDGIEVAANPASSQSLWQSRNQSAGLAIHSDA